MSKLDQLIKSLPHNHALCRSEKDTNSWFILKFENFDHESNNYVMKYVPLTEYKTEVEALEAFFRVNRDNIRDICLD